MLKAVPVALCCLIYLSGADQSRSLAWWVTWSIRPTGTEVEGVPVRVLDPSWRYASVIRPSDISATAGDRPEDYGMAFSVDTDLDGDSQDERVVVGAFETAQGELGRFLLILDRVKGTKTWTRKALFSVVDSTPFSAVDLKNGVLRWHGCLACDDVCAVVRIGAGFRLECEPL